MKLWWSEISLGKKLHIPIQLTLLIVLPLAQLWLMSKLEDRMLENVRFRAEESATQSILSLNAMMLSGTISNPELRATFFRKMAKQHEVADYHLVRGAAVREQFGPGLLEEHGGDALDSAAQTIKVKQFAISRSDEKTLRVVVPFVASEDFYGTNCMQCHRVPEGTVLGTVSLTFDLNHEYDSLAKFGAILLGGQIALQLLLFLLIGWVIKNVTGSVVKLEQTMLEIRESNDFSQRAEVIGKDEIGHIAQVFNGFIAQIESLYQELALRMKSLETYHDKTEEELRIGSDIMSRITNAYSSTDHHVRTSLTSASHYSGDLILVSHTPEGHLHILLADAVGHGLTAAINLLPLSQVFDAMSKKGFSVGRVAEEMNLKINQLMPADRFVGAALVSVDFRNQVIEVWNGGLPAPILLAADGSILRRWPSRNLPLGILGERDFVAESDVYSYGQDAQLLLFSDGLLEAESPEGLQLGMPTVESMLVETQPEARFDELIHLLNGHLKGRPAHDDVSLAMVNLLQHEEVPDEPVHSHRSDGKEEERNHWKVAISLGDEELRYLDVVPMLTQFVGSFRATSEHHSALYMIVAELFNNALDHGILKLDSRIKQGADGFDQYLRERAERLQELHHAQIEIEIERVQIDGRSGVKILIRDSGDGFNYAGLQGRQERLPLSMQHGRGLALIREIVSSLEFNENGNEVVAYYICG